VADPAGILGEIVGAKRAEVASRFARVSLDALRAAAKPTRRSLTQALARPGARFILEIKKASPSEGAIRRGGDPAELARGYSGVADALSVLIDGAYFGGSIEDLAAARTEFDGPILAKDFFLDPRQLLEARIAGADAVLIMLSVLDDEQARDLIAEARRFGMDVLVEVHDETEMRRALALGEPLIGINNRDLRDLTVDLSTTERLARLAPGRTIVAESGIGTRSDVERLTPHVDAFLIGTTLMRADDPGEAARSLIFGRVKLCGLNHAEDFAKSQPATFAGFVFVRDSIRHITAGQGIPLAKLARGLAMRPVGVFRDEAIGFVADIANRLRLHAVQLHGREDDDYVAALRRQLPEACEIWTAVNAGPTSLSDRAGDRRVFDNGSGGTGQTFDWRLLRDAAIDQAIIAGGIGPHNAGAAQRLGAYAIDVGSALDERPGRKSPDKIAALFDALRPACRKELRACA
jgi:indole-3-glycerol phosphate synthase/phosphoribosylanthranilate isomerase